METLRKSLVLVGEALGIRNLDPDAGLIFITGGTGVIGHRIASKLLGAGYKHLRVAAHSLNHVQELNKLGAEVSDFAWNREESYGKALKGVKTVVCTAPYCEHWERHFDAFLQACIKANVKHFIKLSFCHARDATEKVMEEVPLIRAHGACDQVLVNTLTPHLVNVSCGDIDVGIDPAPKMGYTILYSSFYMSNPLVQYHTELHRGENDPKHKPLASFYGASGNKPINYVSPNDVAEVVVRVAIDPCHHYNKEYMLTGKEFITDQDVADLLSKHLERPVMYIDQPLRVFERQLCAGGEPAWHVLDLIGLERLKQEQEDKNGKLLIEASPDIMAICGRPPQTFEEYLKTKDLMSPLELPADAKGLKEVME